MFIFPQSQVQFHSFSLLMSKTPPLKWRNSFAFTESGGGEVKHERIQTGVEGAGQECVVPSTTGCCCCWNPPDGTSCRVKNRVKRWSACTTPCQWPFAFSLYLYEACCTGCRCSCYSRRYKLRAVACIEPQTFRVELVTRSSFASRWSFRSRLLWERWLPDLACGQWWIRCCNGQHWPARWWRFLLRCKASYATVCTWTETPALCSGQWL